MFRYFKWMMVLATALSAEWLSFGGEPGAPAIDVNLKSAQGVHFSVTVPGVEYELTATEAGNFVELKMEGYGYTTEIGLPKVPVIRRFIEVPFGADVKATLSNQVVGSMYLTERVMPVQPSRPKTGEKVPFAFNRKFYSNSSFYPEIGVKVKEAGVVRGHRLFVVEVFPISYNPATGEMKYLVSGDVDIDFIGGDWGKTEASITRHSSLPFELKLRKDILNYGAFEASKPALELPLDYLFIVPDDWVSALQPLVNWKKAQGYRVTVATLSQTGNSTDAIKAYIQNFYDDPDRNLTFVTLVGDVDQIPNWVGVGANNPATDLYYTTLEGDDYFPDVYIGRLSVQTEEQLNTVVNKIVGYESLSGWTNGTDWARYAYFMASDDGGHHQVAESTHVYCMRIVRRHGMETDSMWEYYSSGTPPVQAINAGKALSIYSGHGSQTGWAGPSMSINDVHNLTNEGMLTHVESYACLTGQYTQDECFMEAWLRASNGAITAMGSSVTSYWDEDDILQRRIFDEWFDSTYYWVSGNIVEGKYDLYLHYNGGGRTQRYYEMYNLFGDPSTDVFTLQPVDAYVTMPNAIPVAPSQVQVHVEREGQPVAYALVTFMQQDSIIGQGYTDESGDAMVDVAPVTGGDVNVAIIGHNIAPYQRTIVAVSEGAYVGFVSYQLDDSQGNGNGMLDAGETVNLTVLARNYGNQDANNVYGILSTTDPYVTIVADSACYGSIPAHDSAYSASNYVIQAALNIPDQHRIQFELAFTDANDSTWVSRFSIVANAPNPVYMSYDVIDTLNGNGNGVAEPGEEIEVWVTISNTGHTGLSNVTASISTDARCLTIVRDTASFGYIPSSGMATTATPYVIQVSKDAPAPVFPLIHLNIQADGGFQYVDSFNLIVGRTGLFSAVEGDTIGWTHGGTNDLWHVSSRDYHSASHSFYSGDETSGQYTNDMDAWLMTPIVVLGLNAHLDFWTKYEFESCCDHGYVEISTDEGNTWTQLQQFNGQSSGWTEVDIDLSGYAIGTVAYIRFRQTSDYSVTREGWYIDDIAVIPPNPPGVLSIEEITVADSNRRLDPGDVNLPIVIAVSNVGGDDISDITGILRTSSSYITIVDSEGTYGTLLPDSVAIDTFILNVAPEAVVGEIAPFTLELTGNGGAYTISVDFELVIGDPRMAPVGPDSAGYLIYDSEDPLGRPFEWIEIEDVGTPLNLGDDDITTVTLPSTFRFYGQDYNELTISSNGWVSFLNQSNSYFPNDPIPNTDQPNAIIAGVWDDLNPNSGGQIYTYFDSTNGYFIVEYKGVPHYASTDQENFEIVLLPTTAGSDGNNEILINYLTPPSQADITVGIENESGTVGLQYLYDGEYDQFAHEFTDSFTLYITCNAPSVVENGDLNRPLVFSLMPAAPNPMTRSTNIMFALPHRANVRLDVYDASGRLIRTLANGVYKAGYHKISWNGTDANGYRLPAGVYIYRLKADNFVATKKLVILK